MVLPDVRFAVLSLRAWTPTPVGSSVHIPVTSRGVGGLPTHAQRVGFQPQYPGQRLQSETTFRGCNHFLMFRPAGLFTMSSLPQRRSKPSEAAMAFTSEQNAVCYLPAHRIC